MTFKRREFLQRMGWLLGALGISETGFWQLSDRYSQALAQPTGRKLALLVGINDYPETPLKGCVTDVELQRELLIYKYGFQPADILSLTDKEATRENIETAFLTHLSAKAQPGDAVVFHFSGKGSCITSFEEMSEPDVSSQPKVQNSLVPVDGASPTMEGKTVNDLLTETLWLLLRSLPTDRAIAVLDTSYNYPGTDIQGSLRVRCRSSPASGEIDIKEKAMQSQLRQQLNISLEEVVDESQFSGVLLSACKESQFATETDWNGFSSGLFTYALTQALWEATPATKLQVSFSQGATFVEQLVGPVQQPQLKKKQPDFSSVLPEDAIASGEKKLATPIYLSSSLSAASGAIESVDDTGKNATLWLGGLPLEVLESLSANSVFAVVPQPNSQFSISSAALPLLQVRSRSGLSAKAAIVENPNAKKTPPSQSPDAETGETPNADADAIAPNPQSLAGQLVREQVRVLPKLINLTIALDQEGLSRIERVDATSGFSAIPQVSAIAGNQPADYIFSRVRERAIASNPNAPLPSFYQGRYGLFSLGEILLPNTVGEGGEAAKVAVQRLTSQLKVLQAGKLLRLTENQGSSGLKVRVTLATVTPESKVLMQRATISTADAKEVNINSKDTVFDSASSSPKAPLKTSSKTETVSSLGLTNISVGSQIQWTLYNDSDEVVYFILLAIDTGGRAMILDPKFSTASKNSSESLLEGQSIPPYKSATVPPIAGSSLTDAETFGWRLTDPEGVAETYVIFSSTPFSQTIAALEGQMGKAANNYPIKEVLSPAKVAKALLQDLNDASKPAVEKVGLSTDDWAFDTNFWATLRFVYRIV